MSGDQLVIVTMLRLTPNAVVLILACHYMQAIPLVSNGQAHRLYRYKTRRAPGLARPSPHARDLARGARRRRARMAGAPAQPSPAAAGRRAPRARSRACGEG